MRNVVLNKLDTTPIEKMDVELVERKGVGHPDSICDGVAESISRALSREYIRRYGAIAHHNTDKVQLAAGRSVAYFGGGEVLQPLYFLIAGRATDIIDGSHIPIHSIATRATRHYIKSAVRNIDVDEHCEIFSRIGHGSGDLVHLFDRTGVPKANDTSFGVGYAPLSRTETLVLDTEKLLNSSNFKKDHPETGEDIKVMGSRVENRTDLSVAVAFVSRHVPDARSYLQYKEDIRQALLQHAKENHYPGVNVHVNTADDPNDPKSFYLTVTGTSAEAGDDGCVGRGNRVNGLITPHRTMSLEAAAGKNPVSHVGKIYNILANKIAQKIVDACGAKEVHVKLLSQIGKPVDQPLVASVNILNGADMSAIKNDVLSLVEDELAHITAIQNDVVEGRIAVF